VKRIIVCVEVCSPGAWDSQPRLNRFLPPSDEIEPIGVDSISAFMKCPNLSTIIFVATSEPHAPCFHSTSAPLHLWQQEGIRAALIMRYTGDEGECLLVIRNLSRSSCRGYWDGQRVVAKDHDTESWADESIIEDAIVNGSAAGEKMGHTESDYRWRTAMAYGRRSLPTWLGSRLLRLIMITEAAAADYSPNQILSEQPKRILKMWKAAEYPWVEPAWWKYAA
jgi:hypothetical protein